MSERAPGKHRTEHWIALGVLAVGLPMVGVLVFVAYVSSVKPLHPSPTEVTSVARVEPATRWADAVRQGREIARAGVAQQNVPGLSVAVGVGGEIVWAEGFGWADIGTRAPVAPETRFRIGHVSKAITSAAVGLLLESGQLRLSDAIQTYVPEYPEKGSRITLRQVMAHTAGVRHYKDTEWGDRPTGHCARAADGVRTFANDPLLFEPDAEYRYSTYGWVLVSAAVEAVAGQSLAQFLRARVFDPLGMSQSGEDVATSYVRNNFNNEIASTVDYSCFAGGGALVSTPSDLVRFGLAVLGGKLLKAETVTLLQTRQQLTSGQYTDYGLGWMLDTVELGGQRTAMAGHASRTIEGASSSFLTFPERGIVVAVSSNISFADMRSIAFAIAEAFAGRPSA